MGMNQPTFFHVRKTTDGTEILTAETSSDCCACSPTSTVVNLPNGGFSVMTVLALSVSQNT